MATVSAAPPTQCPVRSSNRTPARCPVANASDNPRNNMPVESQEPAPGQSNDLPTMRVMSSIPRAPDSMYGHQGNTQENSEYPSPQQFYNALLRKGWNMPEGQIEAMVHIHNRINEDAWKLVLRWDSRFHGGYSEAAKLELVSFSGIHGHLSNKARLYKFGKRFFPSYFTLPNPFDRHDWIVRRPGTGMKARYVIDYHGAKNARGDRTFAVDVRPALDSFGNVKMRMVAAIGRILSDLDPGTSDVARLTDRTLVKCGLCLLIVGISLYIRR